MAAHEFYCEKVCKECGTVGEPVTITKGSLGTEILLWLCLPLPGMFYTAWRHGSRYNAKCSFVESYDVTHLYKKYN